MPLDRMRLSREAVLLAAAVTGWAMCGATMGIGIPWLGLNAALALHALVAPAAFFGLGWLAPGRAPQVSPAGVATRFLGVVVVLDVGVVAPLIQHSFEMFESLAGTWLPFGLIWAGGWAGATLRVRGAGRRRPAA